MRDLNDKVNGNNLSADEWNDAPTEAQNVIEATNQTLTASDLNQLGKGVSEYSVTGDFYLDSGVGNAYVLSPTNGKQAPSVYNDGASFRFKPLVVNTGASTIAIAGLPVSPIFYNGVALLADRLQPGKEYTITRDDANSRFNITKTEDSLGYNTNYYSVAHLRYTQKSQLLISDITGPYFRPDGLKVYVEYPSADDILQFPLTVPYDISTIGALEAQYSHSVETITATDLSFRDDTGARAFLLYNGAALAPITGIQQYDLGTNWDISTSVPGFELDINTEHSGARALFIRADGLKMFTAESFVRQWTLTTPWDLSTATIDAPSFLLTVQDSIPVSIKFHPLGTEMYMLGNTTDRVYVYRLPTPWDLTNIFYTGVSADVRQATGVSIGLTIHPTGSHFYSLDQLTGRLYEHSTNFITG